MKTSLLSAFRIVSPLFLVFGLNQVATAQSLDIVTCGAVDTAMQLGSPFQNIRYFRLQMTQLVSAPNLTVVDGVSAGANGRPQGFDLRGFVDKVEQPSMPLSGSDSVANAPVFNLKFSGDTFLSPNGADVFVTTIRVHYSDAVGAWEVDLVGGNGQPIAGTGALGCQVDTDALLQLARHSAQD